MLLYGVGYHFLFVLVAQSCLTLCNPMDYSLPGFSVHGILQARILEWVAISFSRESSQPMDRTWVSWVAGRFFTIWATREASFFKFESGKIIQPSATTRSDWTGKPFICPRSLDLKLEYLLKAKQTNNKKLRNLQEMDFLHLIHFNCCIYNFSHWVIS